MKNSGVTAQMLVRNEEQWIWYAIDAVLPIVQKILLFDTGSTDRTMDMVRAVHSSKLTIEEKGNATRERLTLLRNEMKERVTTEWFLLVDGDEIWPQAALRKLTEALNIAPKGTWGMVVRTRNCVGDVWHYQPESAGRYKLLGRKGHRSIRAYRNLAGFRWKGEYPNEAYCDERGNPINHQDEHLGFVDAAYWHVTHLNRSRHSKKVIDRKKKKKLEIGIRAKPQELPEVFFSERPPIVPSPFMKINAMERIGAAVATPLRRMKRRIFR